VWLGQLGCTIWPDKFGEVVLDTWFEPFVSLPTNYFRVLSMMVLGNRWCDAMLGHPAYRDRQMTSHHWCTWNRVPLTLTLTELHLHTLRDKERDLVKSRTKLGRFFTNARQCTLYNWQGESLPRRSRPNPCLPTPWSCLSSKLIMRISSMLNADSERQRSHAFVFCFSVRGVFACSV